MIKVVKGIFKVILVLFAVQASAQDYLDIVDLGYTYNPSSKYKTNTTSFSSLNLKVPILFKNGDAVIVGANYNLFHVDSAETEFHFYNVTLPLGLHKVFSEKLSADFILLNRLNTDFNDIDKGHFQYG